MNAISDHYQQLINLAKRRIPYFKTSPQIGLGDLSALSHLNNSVILLSLTEK